MSEPEDAAEEAPKRSKMALILGVILALVGGGGGFYATWSGMVFGSESHGEKKEEANAHMLASAEIAYVAVDPLVISMRSSAVATHLKFRAQLEVPVQAREAVEKLLPRVIDVLNSYLRALEPGDLEDPAALARLRAQMLRRVQVVTGPGNVNDLLIMEFVLT